MSVIERAKIRDGVAVVTMNDARRRNAFTPELLAGLRAAFAGVAGDEDVRAVVLRGDASWFSSGATREELHALADGRADFRDLGIARLLVDCPVPTIAAIEGHAFGGGLVLGLSADVVVLADEAMCAASFMRVGFTPGMGATRILPERLGTALAQEMLLTGRAYRGAELRSRGAGISIVARADVSARASTIAAELADKPRASLVTLKRHLSRSLRGSLSGIYEHELEMHRATFALPEVRARIAEVPDV
ncbi:MULTISPECIES: polyketide synthase [Sandaracinus]|uniref:polyketide synthase n=1 Tax=Sandaracinus TaxID=1055688 RepID=UPI0019D4E0E6|nr:MULTISPECIES: polyketide synthase [Sandaracinus]QRN75752.1 Enoyl-CoA hydratase/isomerase [Sandaracinus sp.]UJR87252.1 Polyketide biosynthesis enoyl-CoA hydratase PksI [Sandaracinus amylolyticus]